MNQNFTSQQLIKLLKRNELYDYGLTQEDLIIQLDEVYDQIVKSEFSFDIKEVKNYYLSTSLPHKLVMRKLNDNLKRIYKDEQANRRIIIQQIKTLLDETCPMWILKTDIESFYESIDRKRIISKLQNDTLISYHSIMLLNKLFAHPLLEKTSGLPRGINISSTLSEIYMRNFDKWVSRFPLVYYYARFVDDIVIFSSNKITIDQICEQINYNLEEGLIKKESKTSIFNGERITSFSPFEYLGYKFTAKKDQKNKVVTVSISDKKVSKIKSRITISFLDYIKNKDFGLLEKRIKFLTGNFSIRKTKKGNDLKAGIYYNYSQINDHSVLKELNKYYLRALNSKSNSFGIKLSQSLDQPKIKKLSKYSFIYGFKSKVYNSFTSDDMGKIVNCW